MREVREGLLHVVVAGQSGMERMQDVLREREADGGNDEGGDEDDDETVTEEVGRHASAFGRDG